MKLLSIVLVVLYAALNLFLAVAGVATNTSVQITTRLIPCALFAVSAGLLGWGAWQRSTPIVVAGLVCASVAPIVYGVMVEHSNVLLHHAVRAIVAVIIAAFWLIAWRQTSKAN